MTVYELMTILRYCDQDAPITVMCDDVELPLFGAAPTVTREGGGAAPVYYAINVECADLLR